MLCNGNQTEFCGGSSRLNVYDYQNQPLPSSPSTPTTSAASTPSAGSPSVVTTAAAAATGFPTGWTPQGCWVDAAQGRILQFQAPNSDTLTPQSCASICSSAGYIVSGTEYSTQCFCGNGIQNDGVQAPSTDCNMACGGDSTQICGAGDRLSIVSKGTPAAILPPAAIPQVGDWTYQGCYTDNVNGVKTLPQQVDFTDMTPDMCLDRCAEFGFMAAGIEYGIECYCEYMAMLEYPLAFGGGLVLINSRW